MDQVAEPSYFGFQLMALALVVVDLRLSTLRVHKVDSSFILAIDSKGGEVAEVQLNDIITEPGDNLKVVDGDGFPNKDEQIVLTCPFPHFFHLEQGVLGDEESSEV